MEYNSIPQMFFSRVDKYKNKQFMFFEERVYTYNETADVVSKLAEVFKKNGVTNGTKVIIMLNNSPEFVLSVLGLLSCGATVIPMNTFLKEGEATYIFDDSEAEFFVSEAIFSAIVAGIRGSCKKLKTVFSYDNSINGAVNLTNEMKKITSSKRPDLSSINVTDYAIFIYTSGTTGHPKGAILTHKNLLINLEGCMGALAATEKDRFLVMLPMFHTYTFTACVLFPIFFGGSMIILASVMDMKKKSFKKTLIFKRPTFVLGVPQIYAALAKSPMPKWFVKFLYPIKMHVSGGAPLPMETFDAFKAKFGRPVVEGYGLSEASPVVAFNPINKPKHGTVGIPLCNIEAKIVGDDETELPRNTVGELIVKGGNVMQGYWKMPKATDDAIKNGWLFTGDYATMDEENYITIVDRKKDLIIAKGMNVYPREIEEVIYKFPNVAACAVIGIPSIEQGEVISAYIQAEEDTTINVGELRAYLKEHLANFKLPKHINIIDNIPLTATGKVLKRKLKEMVQNKEL